jgi:hypothetical protein
VPILLPSAQTGLGAGTPDEGLPGTGLAAPPGVEAVYGYNGLVINDRNVVDQYVVKEIGGFGLPELRDNREPNPTDHGETPFDPLWSGRVITMSINVRSKTLDKLRDMEQALRQAFTSLDELPLTMHTGDPYSDVYTNCRIVSLDKKESQDGMWFRRDFMLTLRASDPRILSFVRHLEQEGPPRNIINRSINPSAETTSAILGFTASTSGQPAASVVRTQDWAKAGTWSDRYRVTINDAVAGTTPAVARHTAAATSGGATGRPVTAGRFYAFRVSTRIRPGSAIPTSAYARVAWYKADGTSSAISLADNGPAVLAPAAGSVNDLYAIIQAPADAAYADPRVRYDLGAGVQALDVDIDAWMMVDLGTSFTGPVREQTNAADVPAYFDGSFTGYRWTGTAHASTSERDYSSIVYQTTVHNRGNFQAKPKIVITGPITNPVVTNISNGHSFGINKVLAPGEEIIFDMTTPTPTLTNHNGINMFRYLSDDADFIRLEPLDNLIRLEGTNGGEQTLLSIYWNDSWL